MNSTHTVIDILFVCVTLRSYNYSPQNLSESVHLYAERYFHVLTKAVGMSE